VPLATGEMLARLLEPVPEAVSDETIGRILDATLEQFLLVGLRRTTIDDVARRAGVGRVTIYRRVGHKRDLVEATLMREVRRVVAMVDEQIASLPDTDERLVEGFVVGLRAFREHPLLQRLLETEPEDLLPYMTLKAGASLALGRKFVTEQIRIAHPDARDPELVAEIITRLAQSLVLTPDGEIPLEDERRTRAFARACLAPLAARS
jgi:AcrR family transcriptional regulator